MAISMSKVSKEADVVLVGVSRTSKTPTSIYFANRGIRTANVNPSKGDGRDPDHG